MIPSEIITRNQRFLIHPSNAVALLLLCSDLTTYLTTNAIVKLLDADEIRLGCSPEPRVKPSEDKDLIGIYLDGCLIGEE